MVRIYLGLEAERLLSDEWFRRKWAALYEACPWGTCFQDAPFLTTWYRCYSDRFQPIILAGEGDGQLVGLFTLAMDKRTKALYVAGTYHAEYHVWLALPGDGGRFIEEAVAQVARAFPRGQLELLFVPPKTPLDWTKKWGGRCHLPTIARPLMGTQPADQVLESVRKKSNRSRLNRLGKEGTLSFERIADAEDFGRALEAISTLCDFRQGGAHGVLPFHEDPRKKAFYTAMMEQPGLLHATVLRLIGQIVAAHIGQCNKREVVLGLLTHSPFFARHSVGKLHILLLGQRLEQDSFQALDLTPGGEYKDRFASHYDEAHVLRVFFSRSGALAFHARRAMVNLFKRFIGTDRIKHALQVARHKARLTRSRAIPGKLWHLLKRFVHEQREYRIYRYAAEVVPRPLGGIMHRDCLQDLILYAPAEAWQPPRDQFLREVARHLEEGGHVYTHVEGGRLAHYGWLIEGQREAFVSQVGQQLELPPDSAVLYNFYTHPEHRGKGFYQHALAQMTYDAANIAGTKHVYIGALKENATSCQVIEKVGFQYRQSLFQRRCLGRVKRW